MVNYAEKEYHAAILVRNLRSVKRAMSLTNSDIARLTGIEIHGVSRIFSGYTPLGLWNLHRIVAALNKLYTGPREKLLIDDFLNEENMDITQKKER